MAIAERPVDLHHLDRYTGGERSINEEILRLFDGQCVEMLAKLEELAGPGMDSKSWRLISHTLKGAARGIGAFALADAAAEAEKAADDTLCAIAALERIKANSLAVHGFIEEFLKNTP